MAVDLAITDEVEKLWQAITSGRVSYTSFAALQVAIARPLGSIAEVEGDAGTHEDPVSSEIVPNEGVYRRVVEGWQWLRPNPLLMHFQRREFTATEGQTVFSFSLPAVQGFVAVYLNGVRLAQSDFTQDGGSITLAVPAVVGDIIVLEGFDNTAIDTGTALREELAEATGAEGVGFIQSGSGAVGRTALAELRNVVTPYQFGATGDGVADDTAELQAAVTAAIAQGKVLDLLTGTYKITGSITGSGNVRIINSGGATILAAAGTYSSAGALVFSGSATQVADLSASPAKGATAITTATATGMAAGDIGFVYNPTDGSFSAYRPSYRAGEFFEVASAAANTLNLRAGLYAGYTNTAVDVYKVTPITGFIRDVIIEASGGPSSLILITYAKGFEIINPVLRQAENDCITFSRSVHCRIDNPHITNAGGGSDEYGISWANCQHCRTVGGEIYAPRHPHMTGGGDYVGAVPCRDIVCTGSVLRNDLSLGVHSADFHGNSEFCQFDNCSIYGGISLSGKDCGYLNCRVWEMGGTGWCATMAEVYGGTLYARGCSFTSLSAAPTSDCLFDLGAFSAVFTASVVEKTTIDFTGNKLVAPNLPFLKALGKFALNGCTQTVNFVFDDWDLDVPNAVVVLRLERVSGTADSEAIISDRIRGLLTGSYPVLHNTADYVNFPHRLPAQKGVWSYTTIADRDAYSANTAFDYPFPRVPKVESPAFTGAGGVAASPKLTSGSHELTIPYVYRVRDGDIILALASNTPWTAGTAVEVHWTASIREV